MNSIMLSTVTDPYTNVAVETQLFNHADNGLCLYLWINDPCVIIGRNQNPYRECNTGYLQTHGISLVRRFSGGGAVYQDKGNLNYTFVSAGRKETVPELVAVVTEALQSLGIESSFSGRNDLTYKGRKFSGTAWRYDEQVLLCHGTLMVSVDLDNLEQSLHPSPLKLRGKSIESVRSRVVNLNEVNPALNTKTVADSIIARFKTRYAPVTNTAFAVSKEIMQIRARLTNTEWLYGECPDYNLTLEKKINESLVTLKLAVSGTIITDAAIYTDSLESFDRDKLTELLKHSTFDENRIWNIVQKQIPESRKHSD